MAIEKHWDLMRRASSPYGTHGLTSYAISAVDNALWDLKGKLLGRPVYELLGGPVKDKIFCYASNTTLTYGTENLYRVVPGAWIQGGEAVRSAWAGGGHRGAAEE